MSLFKFLRTLACGVIAPSCLFAQYAIPQTEAQVIEPIIIALPLADVSSDGAGCKSVSEIIEPGAKAYAQHLETRFNTDVTLCLTASPAEAVAIAERGEANLVWVDQATVDPLLPTWRSSLSLRSMDNLGRTPFVLFAKAQDKPLSVDDIAFEQIGYQNILPEALNVDLALRVLSDYGIDGDAPSDQSLKPSVEELMQAVDSGVLKAGILEANAWARACMVLEPDSTLCDHYQVVMYDRPRAQNALMIPKSTPAERHFRLVGVHIGLHFENPDAFAWLSQGRGSEFDPAEPTAMAPKSNDTAVAF